MAKRADNGQLNIDKDGENIDEDDAATISQMGSVGKKSGGSKKLLVMVISTLIAGGGGFAGYHFLSAKNKTNKKTGEVVVKSRIAPGHMVELKPFLTNLADKDRTAYIKVTMVIELRRGGNVPLFKRLTPEIRNNIIMILNSKTTAGINTPDGIVSLRHEIARGLNRILGAGAVVDVYFNNYLVQ